jgi:hypothetical protein
MRTKILIFLTTLALSTAAGAADEKELTAEQKQALKEKASELNETCSYPEKPAIPDGRNSTEDEMLAAQKKMKAFIAGGNEYIACLQEVEKGWGKDASDDEHALVVVLHNKAVDEMKSVADMFNSAVRAYKGKN